MRLDKFLCHNLGISRTQAKTIVKQKRVKVDQAIIKDSAFQVADTNAVSFDDVPVSTIGNEYYLLYKPQGYVCTNKEGLHPMVFDLIDLVRPETYHAAGRLDLDSTGLVLITNDGQWSHRVTSPQKKLGKTYVVDLDEPIGNTELAALEQGVQLNNEKKLTKPAILERISESRVRITVHEGKYHQVKRMFAAVNNHVVALHRECIGSIRLEEALMPGEYRALNSKEIASIDE